MITKTKKPQYQEWTMEDIYNLLMYDIEPELMTDMIPQLDDLYPNETPEEHTDRMQRYNESFHVFYMRFDLLLDLWKDELKNFRKEMFEQFKRKAMSDDDSHMSDIESSLRS